MVHPTLHLLRQHQALPVLRQGWRSRYFELVYRGEGFGWFPKRYSKVLQDLPEFFAPTLHENVYSLKSSVEQSDIDMLVQILHKRGLFTGWRGEAYAARRLGAMDSMGPRTLFTVERASARVFGLVRFSIHVNGFIRQPQGKEVKYWMGRRSKSKSHYPNMLDQIVAGGLPHGMLPLDCAVKECQEEASIQEDFARRHLKLCGSVTRLCEDEQDLLSLEEIFIFDLDLTEHQHVVVPQPCDGEVAEFILFPSCTQLMSNGELIKQIKPNVLLVLTDFALRHGLVSADDADGGLGYLELIRAIHVPIPQHIYSCCPGSPL